MPSPRVVVAAAAAAAQCAAPVAAVAEDEVVGTMTGQGAPCAAAEATLEGTPCGGAPLVAAVADSGATRSSNARRSAREKCSRVPTPTPATRLAAAPPVPPRPPAATLPSLPSLRPSSKLPISARLKLLPLLLSPLAPHRLSPSSPSSSPALIADKLDASVARGAPAPSDEQAVAGTRLTTTPLRPSPLRMSGVPLPPNGGSNAAQVSAAPPRPAAASSPSPATDDATDGGVGGPADSAPKDRVLHAEESGRGAPWPAGLGREPTATVLAVAVPVAVDRGPGPRPAGGGDREGVRRGGGGGEPPPPPLPPTQPLLPLPLPLAPTSFLRVRFVAADAVTVAVEARAGDGRGGAEAVANVGRGGVPGGGPTAPGRRPPTGGPDGWACVGGTTVAAAGGSGVGGTPLAAAAAAAAATPIPGRPFTGE